MVGVVLGAVGFVVVVLPATAGVESLALVLLSGAALLVCAMAVVSVVSTAPVCVSAVSADAAVAVGSPLPVVAGPRNMKTPAAAIAPTLSTEKATTMPIGIDFLGMGFAEAVSAAAVPARASGVGGAGVGAGGGSEM